jgi:hypothetical protein
MGWWSNVKEKAGKAISGITGENLDTSISNNFNPLGLGFTTTMDATVGELLEQNVNATVIRHEGHEAIRYNEQSQGEKLLATARKMDEKGEKAFSALNEKYGEAIVNDSMKRVDYDNKYFSQLPDAALKDNNEVRPETPEARFVDNGSFEKRRTNLLDKLKSFKDKGLDAASAFFDKAANLAERVQDGIEDGVAAGLNGVANGAKFVGKGIQSGAEAVRDTAVIGAALAVNAGDDLLKGVNENVVQPSKRMAMQVKQDIQIGSKMLKDDVVELGQEAKAALQREAGYVMEGAKAYRDEAVQFGKNAMDATAKAKDNIVEGVKNTTGELVQGARMLKDDAVNLKNDLESRAKAGVEALKKEASKEGIASRLDGMASKVSESSNSKSNEFAEKAKASEYHVKHGKYISIDPENAERKQTIAGQLNEGAAAAVSSIGSKFSGFLNKISGKLREEKAELNSSGLQITGFNNLAGDTPAPQTKGTVEMDFTSQIPAGAPPKTPKGAGARVGGKIEVGS